MPLAPTTSPSPAQGPTSRARTVLVVTTVPQVTACAAAIVAVAIRPSGVATRSSATPAPTTAGRCRGTSFMDLVLSLDAELRRHPLEGVGLAVGVGDETDQRVASGSEVDR